MKKLTLIIILAMSTAAIDLTNAQPTQKVTTSNVKSIQKVPQKNPYTLVYDGAITEKFKRKSKHPSGFL